MNNKPSLLLVDRRALHRERIKPRLEIVYDVTDYGLLADACRYARLRPPAAMVICEDLARGGDFYFLRTLRLERTFRSLPIIVILSEKNPAQSTRALQAGATACLAKPYSPSALAVAISAAISKACERQWEALPPLPAVALKSSVAIFDAVATRIAQNETVSYADISAACAPLLAAIQSDNIKSLLQGVQQHDNYAYAHSLRVAVFLSVFGHHIGLSTAELSVLTSGGVLLDVGKTTLSPLLLNKPGRLTESEYGIMRGHVRATMDILEKSSLMPEGVLIIAGQHHEKLDGSGYPHALPGFRLNELARMAAITDVFAALTDRRVYRPTKAPEEAFALMKEEMSGQLDLPLLRCFREIVHDTNIVTQAEQVEPILQ